MKSFNKKGFTLVELLAVIIILAIIILFAMPAVINVMEQSQKSSFKNEVNEVARLVETGFTKRQLKNDPSIKTLGPSGNQFRYMCKTLAELTKEGDTTKPFDAENTNYKGKYEVFVPVNGGSATYRIYFTNGQFTAYGLLYSYTSSDAWDPVYIDISKDSRFNDCSGASPSAIPTANDTVPTS